MSDAMSTRPGRRETKASVAPFYALTPFTMLDFPGQTACILWIAGCNMRCGYCHNPQIVLGKGTIGEDQVLEFLGKRRGLLDGVVFSGGEATTWPGLARFMAQIKQLGFAIKLDTNGLRPDVVKRLLDQDLLDRVALDYKAPRALFRKVTTVTAFNRFKQTLTLLCAQSEVPVEVRTTVHTDLLGEQDVLAMAHDLASRGYEGTFAIQQAITGKDCPTLGNLPENRRAIDQTRLAAQSPITLEFR
ncbi:anaerobic ribonucleoside-triphosphate reductase activating protein [Qipengyuania gaetbuli]|uniref:anaerobic ribonucleoside-triphosphate reductase activating protein n=1 Tax=Qipengyuania gaetbuli TaxID=266952 RepID=UPI001CFD63BB|nr:anaerobic ribonucleoside-triphosphate reductase activating protein [Qipengyuania gaetbuli]